MRLPLTIQIDLDTISIIRVIRGKPGMTLLTGVSCPGFPRENNDGACSVPVAFEVFEKGKFQ